MGLVFEKYHGLGNDYLVYDCNKNKEVLTKEKIKLICHRNFGVGSDGILVGPILDNGHIKVKIYNPDGSEAEKSGNGVRIFSKYLKDAGYITSEQFTLSTLGGDVEVSFLNKKGTTLKVSMGRLSFESDKIGVLGNKRKLVNIPLVFNSKEYLCTCVSIGNPHCVIPMDSISKEKVCDIGKYSETAEYFPNRINTQIVKVINRNNIQIEIYERGAGYTLASGSSSCAAAGAMYKLGLVDSNVNVQMPGGTLKIEIGKDMEIFMTGNVCPIASIQLADDMNII
jgi:diaminopimelate epimerase